MKPKVSFSIAACALGLTLTTGARADSFDLRVHDRNASVGFSIGTAPRGTITVIPAPVEYQRPSCQRQTGYWATDGYRQVWVTPSYSYVGYWQQPSYYRGQERRGHEWREPKWRGQHGHGRGRGRDRDRHD